MQEIKMLEQESAVTNAMNDLRELENDRLMAGTDNDTSDNMKDLENAVITGDQLTKLRALYGRKQQQLVRKYDKIGRNDPCPCGSGKKYKKCCMKSGKYEGMKVKE